MASPFTDILASRLPASPSKRQIREVEIPRALAPVHIKTLANIVNGCMDNLNGRNAKVALVFSHIASSGDDLLNVLCWLHHEKSVAIIVTITESLSSMLM